MKEYHKIDTVFQRDLATKHKTLLEGVYSNPAFEYLANNEWVFTEKVDGTNIRIIIEPLLSATDVTLDRHRLLFKGKTDNASIPATLVEALTAKFRPLEAQLFAMFPNGGSLYGEGYGARIQKGGGNYRPDQAFVLFDTWVPSNFSDLTSGRADGWWLERPALETNATALGLDIVPILGRGTLRDMVEFARRGFRSTWGDFIAEGLVARPAVELKSRAGHRIITKIKHRDFTSA